MRSDPAGQSEGEREAMQKAAREHGEGTGGAGSFFAGWKARAAYLAAVSPVGVEGHREALERIVQEAGDLAGGPAVLETIRDIARSAVRERRKADGKPGVADPEWAERTITHSAPVGVEGGDERANLADRIEGLAGELSVADSPERIEQVQDMLLNIASYVRGSCEIAKSDGTAPSAPPVSVEGEDERARAFERWCGEGSFEWRGTRAGFDAAIALAASPSSPTGEERNRWIRLFNRLEAAVARHRKSPLFKTEADEALYAAHDKTLTEAAASPSSPTGPTQQTASKVGADSERPTAVGSSPTGSERVKAIGDGIDTLRRLGLLRPEDANAARAALAEIPQPPLPPSSPTGQRVTHGRHCWCSACAAQDWTDPRLAACGMHGPSCPREYAPIGPPPSSPTEPTDDEIKRAREAMENMPVDDWEFIEWDDLARAALTAARGSGSDDE